MRRTGNPVGAQLRARIGGRKSIGGAAVAWMQLGPQFLPFADAASIDLPLSRLLRLSLFQVSVGMALVLLIGTLNRVMIVELGVPVWLVATMVSLPVVFAPLRALVGFRSDHHRSVLGWKRVPYIWFGSLLQFGGLAIMPFSLILLSGDSQQHPIVGQAGAALAFLMVGAGLHTTQTVGMALATDLAPPESHGRVVALMALMLLVGMVGAAVGFGALLADFSQLRLIQVIQGAAVATMVLNGIALWKQEPRNPAATRSGTGDAGFLRAWNVLRASNQWTRRLVSVGLGAAAFSMQDILLEPYGGKILGLSVAATTTLTALLAGGGIAAFATSAALLGRGTDPHRLAGLGAASGTFAFAFVIMAGPMDSALLFGVGTLLIGFGAGLFTVGTLSACMALARPNEIGLTLGAWGAVQATAAGIAMGLGGLLRDGVAALADAGLLGSTLSHPATGYGFVYLLEIGLLFATIAAIGPLVRTIDVRAADTALPRRQLGMAGSA